jgi:hypothetical protein
MQKQEPSTPLGRNQLKGKAKGNPSTHSVMRKHSTLKVFDAVFTKSMSTPRSGALITQIEQVESQLQPPDHGVILVTLMGILLPLVGQTHLDLPRRKENRHIPRVKAERAITATGNGKAQISQQGTLSNNRSTRRITF